MRNRDMPARPSRVSFNRERTERIPYQFGNDDFVEPGLTKREYAAIQFMSAFATNPPLFQNGDERLVAKECMDWVDALFDELEKDA